MSQVLAATRAEVRLLTTGGLTAGERLAADFLQLRETFRDEGVTPGVSEWVRTRVPEWLRFHISVNDHPLGVYLARRRAQVVAGRTVPEGDHRRS